MWQAHLRVEVVTMPVLASAKLRAYLPVRWQRLDQALARKPQQIPLRINIDAQILRHFEDRAGRHCVFEWHVRLLLLLLLSHRKSV